MRFIHPTSLCSDSERKICSVLEQAHFLQPVREGKPEPLPKAPPAPKPEKKKIAKECTREYSDGSVMKGTQVDGVWQGPYTKTCPDGSYWEGTMVDGHTEGKLAFVRPSGERHEGEWHNKAWNGPGTVIRPGDGVLKAVWKDGKIEGDASISYENGFSYTGGVNAANNFVRKGAGKLTFPGKASVAGKFDGSLRGKAEILFPNGDKYSGGWNNGMSGYGTYTSRSCPGLRSLEFTGWWKDGEPYSDGAKDLSTLAMAVNPSCTYTYRGCFRNGCADGSSSCIIDMGGGKVHKEVTCHFSANRVTPPSPDQLVQMFESYLETATAHIRQTVADGLRRN